MVRAEMLAKLDKPAPHAFLLVAPSGFGKTEIAAQWANQKPEITVWYTVEAGDSARDVLFHIIEGLRKIKPDFCSWAEDLPESNLDTSKVTQSFSNELMTLGPEVRIVFDNMGDLTGKEVENLNQAWLANAPTNIKTLTIRRTTPKSSFTYAANLGMVTYFTAKDLRFTDNEISGLIKSRGLDAKGAELKLALSSTDGWPAGIQMLIKLFLEKGNNAEYVRDLPQSEEKIIELTLDSLAIVDRDLLFSIALLDDVTESELFKLNVGADAAIRLRNMAIDGSFISVRNYSEEVFTINPLLLQHIRKVLLQDRTGIKERALKALEIVKESDPYRAFELYMLTGEVENARNYIVTNIRRLLFSGKALELNRFVEIVSTTLKFDDERKLIFFAYLEATSGNLDEAESKLLRYMNQFGSMTSAAPIRIGAAADIQTTENTIDFLKGRLSSTMRSGFGIPEGDGSLGDLESARKLVILQMVASAAFLLEDEANLKVALEMATQVKINTADPSNNIYLPSISALYALGTGQLEVARENARLAIASSLKQKPSGIFVPFAAAYCLAEVHREKGELDEALAICDEYIKLASKYSITPWLVALMAKKALVLSHTGRDSLALNVITQAREFVPAQKYSAEMSRIIDEHELLIRVALADTERIKELLFRMPQTDTTVAFASAFEAKQSPTKATTILSSYRENSIRNKLNKALISSEIYNDQPSVAKEHLRVAINLGIDHGYFQVFLLQSPTVRGLIIDLAAEEPTIFLEQLAKKLRAQSQRSFTLGKSANHSLTKRELDILRRLSSGLPITQIAANLHISNNTIKSHLKSVYRKLDVDSRQNAVTKAQELALL
jgi:ATP/maltotriose-dependent transcriptional regulator MalT